MTATDNEDSALVADMRQARSLRTELEGERRHLVDRINKREAHLRSGYSTSRNIHELHSAEAELQHLDRLIEQLDLRFGAQSDGEPL